MLAQDLPNKAEFRGQGLTWDGSDWVLNKELCGVAKGADTDGPYLLFVLTATGATQAQFYAPWLPSEGVAMTKMGGGGSFKYISEWQAPTYIQQVVSQIYAMYDGKAKNAQLVISHGCRPAGAGWCSPGFWRNAEVGATFKGPGAWALVGKSPSDAFDGFVSTYWFGNSLGVTLGTVLNAPNTYSGPPVLGDSGYALNAFNATGAALTNLIPGYEFSWEAYMDSLTNQKADHCPIDHFGNYKEGMAPQ